MSNRKTRRKRRPQAFPNEDGEIQQQDTHEQIISNGQDVPMPDVADPDVQDQSNELNGDPLSEKDQAVWDTFREENYEVLEQLPLSLHRSFTLMRELDEQVTAYSAQLLPSVQQYIALRKSLAKHPKSSSKQAEHIPDDQPSSSAMDVDPAQIQQMDLPSSRTVPTLSSIEDAQATHSATAIIDDTHPPSSTRQMLTRMALLLEDMVRASNEKVNVAKFVEGLVERYERDLDRAIRDQELSLSMGLRSGTRAASIVLPEVIVPKWPRTTRVALTPPLDDGPDTQLQPNEVVIGMAPPEESMESHPLPRKGSQRKSKKKAPKAKPDGTETAVAPTGVRSVRLTVAHSVSIPNIAPLLIPLEETPAILAPIDPNEPTYCFCKENRPNETMVGCDGLNCEVEWFHLGCVGLKESPKQKKWYCPNCVGKYHGSRKKGK